MENEEWITGLTIIEEYITEEEEKQLLEFINCQPWIPSLSRRVQHYGYEYNYKPPYDLSDAPPIPDLFLKYGRQIDQKFNQVIVNEYTPGQGIGKHIDHKRLFGDRIASLSLGSGVAMIFRSNDLVKEFYIQPRTLIIMEEDARWKFTHEIPSRKSDLVQGKTVPRKTRVSLTFRIVK